MICFLSCRLMPIPCVVAVAAIILSSGSAQQTGSQVEMHFLAAQQDQQQGLFSEAAREYQAVLRIQPNLPEAYVNLGLVYYAQSKFEDSARALAAAARLRPDMHGVKLWMGIVDVKLNRPAQATALLREAVQQNPADKLAQSWLGTALWNAGQMNLALLQLRKAARRFPDDPDVLLACGEAYGKAASEQTEQLLEESSGTALSDLIYGTIYAGEREWTKAEGHLHRAIERAPRSLDARLELAEVFFLQARLTEGKEQSDQAVGLAPRSAAALASSGELSLLLGNRVEGLSRLARALEIDSNEALDALGLPMGDRIGRTEPDTKLAQLYSEAAAHLEEDRINSPAKNAALAALYALAGNENASQRAYRMIVPTALSPGSPATLFTQAKRAALQHHYDEAEAELLRWLVANPGDRVARYNLTLARRQISMAQLARLLALAPDSYQVHEMQGQIYFRREEDEKALNEYLAVAATKPDLPGVHFWLGHLYWKHGDAEHALAEFTRELELDPAYPEANGELGAVLVALGRAQEAIPHLESAIKSKPDLWPPYAQLGRAYAVEKNYTRAEEVLKPALAHDPDGATHYQLAMALRAEGKTAQAAEVFAQVRAIKIEMMTPLSTGDVATEGAKP